MLHQTEDQFLGPAGIYRYSTTKNPVETGKLQRHGTLEMLRIKGATSPTVLGGVLTQGQTWDVDWVTIDDPNPEWKSSDPEPSDDATALTSSISPTT